MVPAVRDALDAERHVLDPGPRDRRAVRVLRRARRVHARRGRLADARRARARAAVDRARRRGTPATATGATRRRSATASGAASELRRSSTRRSRRSSRGCSRSPGPPAHEVPVEQARAGHEAETEHLSGPGRAGRRGARPRDPGAVRHDPRARVPARGRGAAPAGRLPARRRLDARLDRVLRHRRARARQRVGRDRGQRRLPARARGAVPGRAGGLPVRRPLAGGQRRRARRATPSGWRSRATAPAATSRPSSRAACAARSSCGCRR